MIAGPGATWTPRLHRASMWLHRWIGLTAGAMLTLVGLTGSFNVFYREIDAALNPALYAAAAPERMITAAEAMRAAATADPAPVTSIIAPDRTWPVWIAIHAHGKGGHSTLWTTMVDPSNGGVLGRRDYTNSLAFTIYRLHSALLLHDWWGKELVGALGIGLLISVLSGLHQWWPGPGRIWRSMSIRKGVSPHRFIIDLHNAAGSWTLPALILIAVTGIGIVFPNGVRPIIGLFSVATLYPSPKATPPAKGAPMLSADQIVEFARAAKPGLDIALLSPPTEACNTWRVLFRPARADPALRSRGAIWLDPWTGALVHDRTPDVMSPGDRYVTEQLWLHNGATFGLIGRLLTFASGFAPLALFVTGFVAWRKRPARQLQRSRAAQRSRSLWRPQAREAKQSCGERIGSSKRACFCRNGR